MIKQTTVSSLLKKSILLPKSSPSPKTHESKQATPPTNINETGTIMASHGNEKTDVSIDNKFEETNVKKNKNIQN